MIIITSRESCPLGVTDRSDLLEGRALADKRHERFGMLSRETCHNRVPAPPHT